MWCIGVTIVLTLLWLTMVWAHFRPPKDADPDSRMVTFNWVIYLGLIVTAIWLNIALNRLK
jgi:hypothetical protein